MNIKHLYILIIITLCISCNKNILSCDKNIDERCCEPEEWEDSTLDFDSHFSSASYSTTNTFWSVGRIVADGDTLDIMTDWNPCSENVALYRSMVESFKAHYAEKSAYVEPHPVDDICPFSIRWKWLELRKTDRTTMWVTALENDTGAKRSARITLQGLATCRDLDVTQE